MRKTPKQHLGINSLHATRHMKNTVVGGVITLNAKHVTAHGQCEGKDLVVLTK